MPQARMRVAQVGLGSRSWMYSQAVANKYHDHAELVGLCDLSQGRMDLANRRIAKWHPPVPTYGARDFDKMIAQARPQLVIITTVDATHADYVCRAMELGCDVVTEKPMTIDEVRCRQVLNTIARTGRKLRVMFNYRYAPPRSQVKEILLSGVIGEITGVDFTWLLDTRHGADYFRRWHRLRENSGSLLVHKATHHFDLVNWWLGDVPEEVFAHGARRFYTPATADGFGLSDRGQRCHGCPAAGRCKFFLDLAASRDLKEMYLDCEADNGYLRDNCVFSDRINIWDTMSLTARYSKGTLLSYLLYAYAPYEGYRIAFNGTKGRLEHNCCENTYISGDGSVPGALQAGNVSTTLIPAFSSPQPIEVRTAGGGHGGGDELLLADVFESSRPDPLGLRATQRDGTYSIMVGIAAYHSIDQGKAIRIPDLLQGAPVGD